MSEVLDYDCAEPSHEHLQRRIAEQGRRIKYLERELRWLVRLPTLHADERKDYLRVKRIRKALWPPEEVTE